MGSYAIELATEEVALVDQIELDALKMDHETYKRQGPLILSLLTSLNKRNAIPAIRLRYWTDPRLHHGRIKASNKGLFERNGTTGNDIYTHPHFLPFLQYFLYGAILPDPVIIAFEEQVGEPKWFSSGDVQGVTKRVRALMRDFSLDKGKAPEEFFRLSLDMGLYESVAEAVLRAAKQVR